jgi:hypothetical protein
MLHTPAMLRALPRLFCVPKQFKWIWPTLTENPRLFCQDRLPGLEASFVDGARICVLPTLNEIDKFVEEFGVGTYTPGSIDVRPINWESVAQQFDAVLLTPYQPRARYRYIWPQFQADFVAGPVLRPEMLITTEVAHMDLPHFDPWYGQYDELDPFRPISVMERLYGGDEPVEPAAAPEADFDAFIPF